MPEQDPLAQLRDIHLPNAIGIWPPAPGWWILAICIITLIVVLIAQWYKRYQRNRYRRQALKALAQLQQYQDTQDYTTYLQHLNALLKRTVLAAKPEVKAAGLSGEHWLEFLDRSANTKEFSEGIGTVLLDGPYRPAPETVDISRLQQLSMHWIKRHRFPC